MSPSSPNTPFAYGDLTGGFADWHNTENLSRAANEKATHSSADKAHPDAEQRGWGLGVCGSRWQNKIR
jgi:hypothetical protein